MFQNYRCLMEVLMYKKIKTIFSITAALLLISLYVATLIFAVIDTPNSANLFKASIYATVVVPVLIYAYTSVYKYYKKKQEESNSDEDSDLSL